MSIPGTHISLIVAGALAVGAATSAKADVTWFIDRAEWEGAIGDYSTADFTGFPPGTFITEQYAALGAHFIDGTDSVYFNPGLFLNDEYGLDGNGDITVTFDAPIYWLAVDYPGMLQVDLYSGSQPVYSSGPIGGSGAGFFFGLLSTEPFDMAVLIDPIFPDAVIDDLPADPRAARDRPPRPRRGPPRPPATRAAPPRKGMSTFSGINVLIPFLPPRTLRSRRAFRPCPARSTE
jgi:hypothetical protein